jgi:hypothetical protein
MSLDHAKKFISKKLQTDAGFRDRVVDFILYRNFLGATADQRNIEEEGELTQSQNQNGENCTYDDRHNGRKSSGAKSLHGYEHWVG